MLFKFHGVRPYQYNTLAPTSQVWENQIGSEIGCHARMQTPEIDQVKSMPSIYFGQRPYLGFLQQLN